MDYTRQDVLVFSVGEEGGARPGAAGLHGVAAVAGEAGSHPSAGIQVIKPEVTREEPLHAELRAFLRAVRDRTSFPPVVSLDDGRRALAVALDILAAIREHGRRISLDAAGPASKPSSL